MLLQRADRPARARAESSFGHGVLDVLNETHALWCGARCRPLAQPGHRRMRRPTRTALARSLGGEAVLRKLVWVCRALRVSCAPCVEAAGLTGICVAWPAARRRASRAPGAQRAAKGVTRPGCATRGAAAHGDTSLAWGHHPGCALTPTPVPRAGRGTATRTARRWRRIPCTCSGTSAAAPTSAAPPPRPAPRRGPSSRTDARPPARARRLRPHAAAASKDLHPQDGAACGVGWPYSQSPLPEAETVSPRPLA